MRAYNEALFGSYQSDRPARDIKNYLNTTATAKEMRMVQLLESSRPKPLRCFDQIPMRGADMLLQTKIFGSYLANQKVVFVGDNDGTSALLGLLSVLGNSTPSEMLVVDFDRRVLDYIRKLASMYGFSDRIKVLQYNVFDKVPSHYIGEYDWFYTNPPYGSRNDGTSARLFIERGVEFVKPDGKGCVILPHDDDRKWTESAMISTQQFFSDHGWCIGEKINRLHNYYLDDDTELTSGLMWVKRVKTEYPPMPHIGLKVDPSQIEHFYGIGTPLPYPRYIRSDGTVSFNWHD